MTKKISFIIFLIVALFLVSGDLSRVSANTVSGFPTESTWPFTPAGNYYIAAKFLNPSFPTCNSTYRVSCYTLIKFNSNPGTLNWTNFNYGGDYANLGTGNMGNSCWTYYSGVWNVTSCSVGIWMLDWGKTFSANAWTNTGPWNAGTLTNSPVAYGTRYGNLGTISSNTKVWDANNAIYFPQSNVVSAEQHGGIIQMGLTGDTVNSIVEDSTHSTECKVDVLRTDTRVATTSAQLTDAYQGSVHLNSRNSINKAPGINYIHSGGIWEGYDWFVGNVTSDTTWKSYFEMAYVASVSSTLKYHTKCDQITYSCLGLTCQEASRTNISDFTDDTHTATIGAILQDNPWVNEPAVTDPLQWVIFQINKMFWSLFDPQAIFNTSDFTNSLGVIKTRAPFAYAYQIFAMDTSSVSTSSAVPDITLHLVGQDYTVHSPAFLSGPLTTLRTAISVVLWLLFLLYCFRLPSRVITK